MAITQDERTISVATPLGGDTLLLESFSGTEAISQPFNFTLFMLSEQRSIGLDSIIGQKVTLTVGLTGGGERFFNGYVRSFAQLQDFAELGRYQAEVVPWLWFLTQNSNSRVFQDKSSPDIIKQIFSDRGFGGDFEDRLTGSYKPRDYCLQYRETDFNFVTRLMEEEGIFYFFEHSDGDHKLVLADSPSAFQDCPNQSEARYHHGHSMHDDDTVLTVRKQQHFCPGKYTLADYHFVTPSDALRSPAPSVVSAGGNSKYEFYQYPGYYARPRFDDGQESNSRPEGDRLAKVRMEAQEAVHQTVFGTSTCRDFTSGFKFTLSDHPRGDFNDNFVITSVTHEGSSNLPDTGLSGYSNSFTALPSSIPFRPLPSARKPSVQGPQTAVVVGKAGEEIWTDKYGRIKVQFHWDREGKKDENSCCWVRVAQAYAGKQWGAFFWPRMGQEVLVVFLEGDPDQPVVVGGLYNAEHMPPYEMPANQTRSGVKTRSSKNGSADNFNELRFEDKKDEEEIYFHAEKDYNQVVENNATIKIGLDKKDAGDRTMEIHNDDTVTVGHDRKTEIKNDENRTVANNRTTNIGSNESITIGGKRSLTIGSSHEITVGSSETHTIASSLTQTVGSSISITSASGFTLTNGGSTAVTSGGPVSITAGGPVSITAPMVSVNAGMLQVAGVVQCTSLIASVGVVSPMYTPGVGNMI